MLIGIRRRIKIEYYIKLEIIMKP